MKQHYAFVFLLLFLFCFCWRISALRFFNSSLTCSALVTSIFVAAGRRCSISTFYTSHHEDQHDSCNNHLLAESLMLLCQCHTTRHSSHEHLPLLVEALLAHLLNLAHTLHSLQRLGHQLAVVLHRSVARLLKLKRRVLGELHTTQRNSYNANVLSVRASERLRPSHLSRIASQIEVLSALGAAETEYLFHYAVPIQYSTLLSLRTNTIPCPG